MPAIPAGLSREQFTLALARLNPLYSFRFLDDTSYEWRGPGSIPADATIQSAWGAVNADLQVQAAADAQDATDHATLAAFDTAMASYIALASPTGAQTADAVQMQARAWRYLARRLQRLGLI